MHGSYCGAARGKSSGRSVARVSDLELRLIRVFQAVVESGGFTAAVPALGIGRSAVSLHMAELETRLGLKLCRRGRAGFALTEDGREVYAAAQRLLSATETFRSEVNALHSELRGELNVGITDNLVSLPKMTVSRALAGLHARAPDVRVNIDMRAAGEVETGVIDGRFHVGVVPRVRRLAALDYRPLYAETAYLYAAATHSLVATEGVNPTADAVAAAAAVQPAYALGETARQLHDVLTTAATASDREGVAFLILTGAYIGFLPEHFAQRWAASGHLRALAPETWCYDIDYALITRRGRPPNRVLATFVALVRDDERPAPGD